MDALGYTPLLPAFWRQRLISAGLSPVWFQISQGYVRANVYYSVSQNKATHPQRVDGILGGCFYLFKNLYAFFG